VKRILLPLLSALLFFACADEKKEPENKPEQALSFSSKTIEKTLDACEPEKGECTFISLTYPIAQNGHGEADKINKTIEEYILKTIDYQEEAGAEKPEDLAENFIKNYQETAAEFPEYELPWEATINGKIFYRTEDLISMKFNTDMFTGGAHGYRSTRYLNFDPDNGKNLEPEDLFTSEFIDYVEKDFREKKDIPMDKNINNTGMFFENDQFHLPQNIGISKDKVILHYNAYEIAPYAAGNFILTYPRSEIQQFLKLRTKPKA